MNTSVLGLTALSVLATAASAQTASSPSAYVYVATNPATTGALGNIYGFSASAAGKLTAIAGSPLASPTSTIALNGKWLFGTSNPVEGPFTANSYSIAANGALKLVDTATEPETLGEPVALILDHTGNTLYAQEYADDIDGYVPFAINQTTGKLTQLSSNFSEAAGSRLTFTADNQFAYGSSCFRLNAVIYGAQRLPSGELSQLGISPKLPGGTPSVSGTGCVYGAAADPYNDVVISSSIYPDGGGANVNQLAVYTYDKTGNLTTTSTYQNMPVTQVDNTALAMSPKGVYLATGGSQQAGLQLFLMHGAKPITVLTGNLLPNVYISQVFWDNSQHLYALAPSANKLYVFNVTSSGATQSVGSPYTVQNAASLIVLPK